ncbi:Predicted DNA-binding protein [Commensalibacter communis]|uniref:Contains ribbon-helix-helix (RHH) domain n=2 Tax=Commensalibacter communis TaxID=2972786 RepID=A0A9W4TLY9_9PROT|nr:ribbon-helix-helix domain-containing protein [Commensalibacter communis]CAI3933147.1 Predicted DNA-binding protein [Commensalibacter communis]CAI3942882.1 Predicted DNA-binding protein [Commensalibacter communis]CAI3944229.1 Predicted DNA-binding protein [Commensalibacter communis]CAI3944418.1 Predicted DNA-binding protein [Commensalibacter communis]CAI3945241.1 Predicted DNA-binding protein [Commensalibacter communis]
MSNPYLQKRSLRLSGHKTSVALEKEFWQLLEQSAQKQQLSLSALIMSIDTDRDPNRPLSSALRLAALAFASSTGER